ncbi:hypothetical protein BUZ67_04035 [Staphylococcus pasteuri]|nr:hypothetical protein BUZ67_04035 [Staphylococcus pasteuri]
MRMVKIKREVKMNTLELIKWNWDNHIILKDYKGTFGNTLYLNEFGDFFVDSHMDKNETFTVEVEEEITEDMVLPSIVVVRTQYFPNNGKTVNVTKINGVSINKIINTQPNNYKYEVHEIYLMNEVGIGELLWKDGAMVE